MSNITINGNQVTGTHANLDEAVNAAIAQAKQGRVVSIAQIVKTVQPNSGVTVTDVVTGQVEVVK